jgi:hypothetical protein
LLANTNHRALYNSTNQPSNLEQIKQLKELLDMGEISIEEYNAKKNQLLGL